MDSSTTDNDIQVTIAYACGSSTFSQLTEVQPGPRTEQWEYQRMSILLETNQFRDKSFILVLVMYTQG